MVNRFFVHGFRNLRNVTLPIQSSLVVFTGANGQGKTNILEALSLVACGSSFRPNAKEFWLPTSASKVDFAEAKIHLSSGLYQRIIIAKTETNHKAQLKCWKNDVPVPKQSFIGSIPVVVFEPQDMNLFYGDPSMRRNFMDNILVQISLSYRQAYARAKKVLANRNHVLKSLNKGEANVDELCFWDTQYNLLSQTIQSERHKLAQFLAMHLPLLYNQFSGQEIKLELHYLASVFDAKKYTVPEKARGYTLSGQHRDDVEITCNNLPWSLIASRGEMRTTILAIKSALLSFLSIHCENKPLCILDDIFSELDQSRRQMILQWENQYQLFISSASDIPTVEHAQIFTVENGEVYCN